MDKNETLTNLATDILKELQTFAKNAVGFTKEELPKAVKELMGWNFFISLCKFISKIVWVAVSIVICFHLLSSYMNNDGLWWIDENAYFHSDELQWTVKGMVYNVFSIVWCINAFVLVLELLFNGFEIDWLKIKTAPRLYLIEYTSDLLKD